MWCRTDADNNVVAELFDYDPTGMVFSGFNIYPVIGPLALYVRVGYTVNEAGEFAPPSIDYLVEQLAAETAARRWMNQQSTRVTYKNHTFITDDNTTIKIGQAIQLSDKIEAQKSGAFSTRWKAPEGFITLKAADVVAVGLLLAQAVQEQFDREDRVLKVLAKTTTDNDPVAKLEAWSASFAKEWPVELLDSGVSDEDAATAEEESKANTAPPPDFEPSGN